MIVLAKCKKRIGFITVFCVTFYNFSNIWLVVCCCEGFSRSQVNRTGCIFPCRGIAKYSYNILYKQAYILNKNHKMGKKYCKNKNKCYT